MYFDLLKPVESTPPMSDSTQRSKESKSSDSLGSLGTPPAEFISR